MFSGCGGLDLGFKEAGCEIVYANDFDTTAQRVYRANLGDIDPRDIRTVPDRDIPDGDILLAGFPCQPFSNAGNRKGIYDSRGRLYLECLRVIKAKRPKAILFENVKGLLSSKHESGRSLIEVIASDLSSLGYETNYKVVNASDYGVPQKRERLILVGIDQRVGKTFVFPKEEKNQSNLTLRHVLDLSPDVPNQVDWPLSPQQLLMVAYIPEGGSWKDIPYEVLPSRFKRIRDRMAQYHSPKFYRRFGLNEIVGTMTASAQPENCGIIHPLENRRLNVREVARIQTFPDDFVLFTDTLADVVGMYKVLGNAVPVKLGVKMGKAILSQVFGVD